jgi:hypothetical protein
MMILNNFHMADAVYFASIRLIKPIAPLPKPKQTSCQFPASKTTRKQNHRILHIHYDLDPERRRQVFDVEYGSESDREQSHLATSSHVDLVPSPKHSSFGQPRRDLPTLTFDVLAMDEVKSYIDAAYLGRWDAAPAWACLPIYPFRSSGNGPFGTRVDSDDGICADFLRTAACWVSSESAVRSINGSEDVPSCSLCCSCTHHPVSGE